MVRVNLIHYDLELYLIRCKGGLKKNGLIGVKENLTKNGIALDEEDSSVTRNLLEYPTKLESPDDYYYLERLTTLYEIEKYPNIFQITMFDLSSKDLDENFPKGTCYQCYFSEYPFIRDEGYRCMKNLHLEENSKDFVNDIPKMHLPIIISTKNAEITMRGYLRKGNKLIIPNEACWSWHHGQVEGHFIPIQVNQPVFIITVYWMDNVWHVLGETMGRMAVHYDYLMSNKNILIHVAETHPNTMSARAMAFFGFPSERLISGAVNAPIALLPELPLYCGVPSYYQMKMLKKLVLKRLATYYPQLIDESKVVYEDYILVIKRSGSYRKVLNHDEMMAGLKSTFSQFKFKIFNDNPSPSIEESFWIFRNARLIIAPHGAGESNLLACREGTTVVEMLTNDNFIHVAYALSSQNLGLNYHGYVPDHSSYKGDFKVDVPELLDIIHKSKF
ncbi:hypothetical protein HK099_005749 [Clydaea vesicula]|uniref:Glycosyltransferase 61 catalytic domain-containing protein n=1 Tax=Clydaea vesicula TaxID=447962 RepID=A0AAD5XUQ6_9FUNG|nr:hypothetical protein HK099_005749 [Clydaea vesicula]